ncbi:hypothetical protein PR202_ga12037 [Eleusine coracana subsp. coracana]|uniref:Uncharacterized protein n=1 Tax=Eleusine coracana subsp. coracana TaxID=191504 RepID=A0AAV5CB24_ELECO|nr:hypothetical protein PR202_ga12037 [Eleusine coracana subsp. coracana]
MMVKPTPRSGYRSIEHPFGLLGETLMSWPTICQSALSPSFGFGSRLFLRIRSPIRGGGGGGSSISSSLIVFKLPTIISGQPLQPHSTQAEARRTLA